MSLYDKLGIPKNASKVEIKKAFRILSLKHHPDRGGETSTFQEINSAYEILIDDEKRNRYDTTGQTDERPQQSPFRGGFPFGGGFPFEHMFRQQRQSQHQPRKLEEIKHTLEITLEEAYFGLTRNIGINLSKRCDCVKWCEQCGSSGIIKRLVQINPFQHLQMDASCELCEGRGFSKTECEKCNGSCQTTTTEFFSLHIPTDVVSGFQFRFPEKGRQPFRKYEIAGDVVVEIKIKEHPKFKKEGKNLRVELEISFTESVIGKELHIPHFDNSFKINLSTFGIIENKKEYIVKEKGMKGGDLIICPTIKYPSSPLSSEQLIILTEAFNKIII